MDGFWSKFKIGLIVIVFIVILGLLFYGLYYLLFVSRTPQVVKSSLYTEKDLLITKTPSSEEINYADTLASVGIKDDIINSLITNSLLTVPTIDTSDLERIIIPQLNVNSAIINDSDGEKSLSKGFWLYPASSAFDGEKVLLCHRRYWGKNNPNSCWYLDQLRQGSIIQTIDKTGKVRQYSVTSSNQLEANDPAIIALSNADVIKIVTCAPLGYSTHRLVVIANRI